MVVLTKPAGPTEAIRETCPGTVESVWRPNDGSWGLFTLPVVPPPGKVLSIG